MKKSTTWIPALVVIFASVQLTLLASDVPTDSSHDEVPFVLHAEHMIIVKGAIEGLTGLNVLIDTGASASVISKKVAKNLGLKGRSKTVIAYGRKRKVREVVLPSLQIGSVRFEDAETQIAQLAFPGMDKQIRIDALIGLRTLRQRNLTIDYASRTLRFGPVSHFETTFAFYNKLPFIVTPMMIGEQRVTLMLDTGAEDLILFSRGASDIPMKKRREKRTIRFLGGKADMRRVDLSDVDMSGTSWEELPAYLLDVPNPFSNLDGILGVASLGLKTLVLDFEQGRISWDRQ